MTETKKYQPTGSVKTQLHIVAAQFQLIDYPNSNVIISLLIVTIASLPYDIF